MSILDQAKARARLRVKGAWYDKKRPYLDLHFISVDRAVVVEVDDGVFLEFDIATYSIIDEGIGHFEHHGFTGNDVRQVVKVTSVELVAVNGEQPSRELRNEVAYDWISGLITATCEEVPE